VTWAEKRQKTFRRSQNLGNGQFMGGAEGAVSGGQREKRRNTEGQRGLKGVDYGRTRGHL